MPKLNCWDVMKCGRAGTCTAARETRLNAAHGGLNGGRACWMVTGTTCAGGVQGTYAQKIASCMRCPFYRQVRQEEAGTLTAPHALLAKLR